MRLKRLKNIYVGVILLMTVIITAGYRRVRRVERRAGRGMGTAKI